ncbi:MAG: hypothetical protein NT005_14550 [Spirochaetes bacterium]|nr:hypothetical protein [Spirochaetota bacterium]
MRRALGILAALFISVAGAQAQDAKTVLETFRRNFAVASLDVKIQILQDAARAKNAGELGPLFQQAVDFVVDNASLIPSDPRFRQLAAFAAEQIAVAAYVPARYSIWRLFQIDSDTSALVNAANALGVIGAGDPEIAGNLNRYLETQNTLFSSGKTPDLPVVAACVQALGKLADPSSFPVVFSAMNLGYSERMSAAAKESLLAIKGEFKENILVVIRARPFAEKRLALAMALDSDRLSEEQKAQVAEVGLEAGLRSSASDAAGKTALREMRFLAARSLGERKWPHAAPLLIEHLDATIAEYDRGLADKRFLLEAAAALGAMGTHEAAVRLTQYLVLVNSYTEKAKGYDEQVVLAVIASLGQLGDKVGFDDLMYTQYLNYSAAVKKAARAALEKLKW